MSGSMSLFNLAESILVLRELLDEEHDDLIAGKLDEYLGALLPEKVNGYCQFMRGLTLEAEAFKAEETRLATRRRAMEALAARMKQRLHDGLVAAGVEAVRAGTFDVRVQLSPESLVVVDEAAVPERYTVLQRTVDKTAVKDALRRGQDVPGAMLVRGTHVRIR